jgi:hypothetical protein
MACDSSILKCLIGDMLAQFDDIGLVKMSFVCCIFI